MTIGRGAAHRATNGKIIGHPLLNQLQGLGWQTFPKSDFLLHLEDQIF